MADRVTRKAGGRPGGTPPVSGPAPRAPWPRWKKAAFGLAVALFASGIGLRVHAWATAPDVPPEAETRAPPDATAFVAATGLGAAAPAGAGAAPRAAPPAETAAGAGISGALAPVLTESGLSFFLGFSIGVALRAMARAAALAIGVALLGAIALQAAGILPSIDWGRLLDALRSALGAAQSWLGHVEGWVAHAVPSGAMGGLGLAAGVKRS